MALFLRKYLSLYVKTDMTQCVSYMPTTKNDKSTDVKCFDGGRPLPEDSTINYLIHIFVSI